MFSGRPNDIRFLDARDLELAVILARAGSAFDIGLVRRYRCALMKMIGSSGAVCQYAIGPGWRPGRIGHELSGHAIALQMLTLTDCDAGRRETRARGLRIVQFVNQRFSMDESRPTVNNALIAARTRDRAWWSIALHCFGRTQAIPELGLAAERIFDAIANPVANGHHPVHAGQNLDDLTALIRACIYFAYQRSQADLLAAARDRIGVVLSKFRHPQNIGFCLSAGPGAGRDSDIDIDVTVEILRAVSSLAHGDSTFMRLEAIQGARAALLRPEIALCRTGDTGILLHDVPFFELMIHPTQRFARRDRRPRELRPSDSSASATTSGLYADTG